MNESGYILAIPKPLLRRGWGGLFCHLGSTSMVTDYDGNVSQAVMYAPFGEVLSEYKRGYDNDYMMDYLFNGKELDEETGMYYYSQRYYDPMMAIFISRDPLEEKYPGISPYAYCANNPLRYVDPTGMTIEVVGSESEAAMNQMQGRSKNLTFSRDEKTGMVSAIGKAKTREEKYMMKIINDKKINVQIKAENTNKTSIGIPQGGAFSGNEITIGRNGKVTHVDALQEVNPSALGKLDAETKSPSGNLIWHEISEGYEGGKISAKTGEAACPSILNEANPIYDRAHYKAGSYFPGTIETYDVTVPDFSSFSKPFSIFNMPQPQKQYKGKGQ